MMVALHLWTYFMPVKAKISIFESLNYMLIMITEGEVIKCILNLHMVYIVKRWNCIWLNSKNRDI